ncbi:MAG: hypothetical protein KF797_07105 [Flavobacteriales bacterium]|nr:hypothetical protein [Flavobacteriales bacterium]
MDVYQRIEVLMAVKYKADTTTRKAAGDFMLSETHAVNVKSNNVKKQNYSPNIISIKRMHEWVYEQRNDLSFIFVDYEMRDGDPWILKESSLIPIERIGWDCLSIEAQGYGVIQKVRELQVVERQTKRDFYKGFLKAYDKFLQKERKKHEEFSKKLIADPDSIDW